MRAAARIRSAPASDVPPNFTTITTPPLPCATSALPSLSSERGGMPDYTKSHSQPAVGSGHLQTRRHDTRRVRGGQRVWPRETGQARVGQRPSPLVASSRRASLRLYSIVGERIPLVWPRCQLDAQAAAACPRRPCGVGGATLELRLDA